MRPRRFVKPRARQCCRFSKGNLATLRAFMLLDAKRHELIFTSGGTEANNLAILGLARGRAGRGKHLISAKTEHHAVLNTIEHLEKREGFEVTWLNVSQAGRIDLDHLTDAIRD